jgi:hypothetical protein
MRRDLELCRTLLLKEADSTTPVAEKWSKDEVLYHYSLLIEAGLLHGHVTEDINGNLAMVVVKRLTWDGQDFLDSIRDESVWAKAKDSLFKGTTSWTFSLLRKMVAKVIADKIGIDLG